MWTMAGRAGSLSNQFVAVTRLSTDLMYPVVNGFPHFCKHEGHAFVHDIPFLPKSGPVLTSSSASSKVCRNTSLFKVTSSLTGGHCNQVRLSHSDVLSVPDFSNHRQEATKSTNKRHPKQHLSGRVLQYAALAAGLGAPAAYVGKEVAQGTAGTLWLAKDTLAAGSVEVDISEIPEGKHATFKWRGKPLFVRHRTSEEIEEANNVNLGELRDRQHDNDRVQKPEWLICIGVCTHLGCVPIPYKGDYNGYFCPCHGSHYDTSGRIRKGPAPENLEIPTYEFLEDGKVFVGDL